MRISDWSSDVCSSDLALALAQDGRAFPRWMWPQWIIRFLQRRFQQFNGRDRSRRNVAHHYDIDGRLYSLFLDPDRQYSCGYFESPDPSLDDAQHAQNRQPAATQMVRPNRRVLDIRCGRGGLGV